MSALEMIAVALAAGAGAGVKDTASLAVRDAYEGLKTLLKRRLTRPAAVAALDADETEPGVWEAQLGDALTESGAADDEQVLAAARTLLELADPTGALAGKYQVDLREAKGVQVGDHNVQHNTFS